MSTGATNEQEETGFNSCKKDDSISSPFLSPQEDA